MRPNRCGTRFLRHDAFEPDANSAVTSHLGAVPMPGCCMASLRASSTSGLQSVSIMRLCCQCCEPWTCSGKQWYPVLTATE